MTRIFAAVTITAAFLSPAWASNPGEPLDCSDWVFLEPGYSCLTMEPYGCLKPACNEGPVRQTENSGNLLYVRSVSMGTTQCPGISGAEQIFQTQLVRYDGMNEVVVGYVQDRCGLFAEFDFATPANVPWNMPPGGISGPLVFDDKLGRMWLPMSSGCRMPSGICTNYGGEHAGLWLATIEGFTTTFEILQTYTPTSNTLSFRVPYMPEGFAAADWFDTYYGTLATVGDWSQLQPLQCSYPASPPSVGDYLTVADPLPTPSPGQGYYYVTAVNYLGERRYGRKRAGGVTSGREPGVLPGCSKP